MVEKANQKIRELFGFFFSSPSNGRKLVEEIDLLLTSISYNSQRVHQKVKSINKVVNGEKNDSLHITIR